MNAPKLELYHWEPNGVFLKPLVALEEKNAGYTSRWFDPTSFEQLAADFPASVESRLMLEREGPLLVADGTVISSSFFMLEYIAEAVPGPALMPEDAWHRYRARAWGQFLGLSLGSTTSALGCARWLAPQLAGRDPARLRAELERVEPVERRVAWLTVIDGSHDEAALAVFRQRLALPVGRIEAALAQGPWLAGPAYSIADIDAYALADPLRELAPEVVNESKTPRLVEWLARIEERPAVRAARKRSRSGSPRQAFVPGVEPARWG
jgi:GSH-dependent disulfide-bond oxidoreductase